MLGDLLSRWRRVPCFHSQPGSVPVSHLPKTLKLRPRLFIPVRTYLQALQLACRLELSQSVPIRYLARELHTVRCDERENVERGEPHLSLAAVDRTIVQSILERHRYRDRRLGQKHPSARRFWTIPGFRQRDCAISDAGEASMSNRG